jgi:hypothetical protein
MSSGTPVNVKPAFLSVAKSAWSSARLPNLAANSGDHLSATAAIFFWTKVMSIFLSPSKPKTDIVVAYTDTLEGAQNMPQAHRAASAFVRDVQFRALCFFRLQLRKKEVSWRSVSIWTNARTFATEC